MTPPIRILLVEDNEVFRETLELLLGMRSDVEVVASIGDGSRAVDACREHRPDVVLMDYRLPGLDGVRCLEWSPIACSPTDVCRVDADGASCVPAGP